MLWRDLGAGPVVHYQAMAQGLGFGPGIVYPFPI
jgi:hypothetical protein